MTQRILKHFVASLLLLPLMSGCDSDTATATLSGGKLNLALQIDNTLTDLQGSPVVSVTPPLPPESLTSITMTSGDGRYSNTWGIFANFKQNQTYYAGSYLIGGSYIPEGENVGVTPAYEGAVDVMISSDAVTEALLPLRIASTASRCSVADDAQGRISALKAAVQSGSSPEVALQDATDGIAYTEPGTLRLYLDCSLADGRSVRYLALEYPGAKAAVLHDFTVEAALSDVTPVITASCGSQSKTTQLTDGFIAGSAPVITLAGANPAQPITVAEGEAPASAVTATVTPGSNLRHLFLIVDSESLAEDGVKGEYDLLNLTAAQRGALEKAGLTQTLAGGSLTVDFTAVIKGLVYLTEKNALSTFSLTAVDDAGRTGGQTSFGVITTPIELQVEKVADAIIGASTGEIVVACDAVDFSSNVSIEIFDSQEETWSAATPLTVTTLEEKKFRLTFPIPQGSEAVQGRIIYCREQRDGFVMRRVMPPFSLDVDPFAEHALIRVNAIEAQVRDLVTEKLIPYVNNAPAQVINRDTDRGLIIIIGLKSSKKYTLKGTMMANPTAADFSPALSFTTESTPALPNGDFEERTSGVSYDKLPAGGRFSQTTVAIYNCQNHTTYNEKVPKEWATVNAKTFCKEASNHNTWYMQPSTFIVTDRVQSGSFAVVLRSVGFDIHGEEIADYTQTTTPFLDYSPVVPHISNKAAGRLFLGSYKFDPATMTETYTDRVSWKSRPSALSGFYRFSPSQADNYDAGYVLVEVYGKDSDGAQTVIASASATLPVSLDYKAFSVPLDYLDHFGVKATHLKVMFCSSVHNGTIDEETHGIRTLPDARTATSTGGTLHLDNLSLAY